MADKLGLGPEVRELKIGDSFSSNKIAFHTMRYDFKPASVVSASKHATIEVGPNHQITVTHLETAGAQQTVFKGSQRPYHKECVLIINKETGDITLEKLSTNIQLKKTRQETQKPSSYLNSQRPPTPVDKKPSPPGRNGNSCNKSSRGGGGGGGVKHSPPIHASPSYPTRSPHVAAGIGSMHKSPPQVQITASSPTPAANSLPILDEFNENSSSSFDISAALNHPEIKTSPDFSNISLNDDEGPSEVGILTDSSSSSSTDSNSSDSESDTNDRRPPTNIKPINGHVNGKSSPLLPSMPSERLLNEDLQLSESGSDSD